MLHTITSLKQMQKLWEYQATMIMKNFTLILLVLTGLNTKAQYFQHVYGDDEGTQRLTDGHNAYSGGTTGHFLVGYGSPVAGGTSNYLMNVQRTDINGRITGPYAFNNSYYVTHFVNPPAMPADQSLNAVESLEFSDGSGFAIAGSYSSVGHLSIFYVRLGPGGNVLASYEYVQSIPKVFPRGVQVTNITESVSNPGDLYITGYFAHDYARKRLFVIKINQSGTILWAASYDLTNSPSDDSDMPNDIIESNYVNASCGCREVIVVGGHINYYNTANPVPAAFALRLNHSNGLFLQADFYTTGSDHKLVEFVAVSKAANPNVDPNGEGYVINGRIQRANCWFDMWFVALNRGGNVIWDNRFQHIQAADIIERSNTFDQYEYYLAGTYVGWPTYTLMEVIKTDEFGDAVPNGRLTYGMTANYQYSDVFAMDQLNGLGPHTDGFSLFGQTPDYGGDNKHLLVKAYFDGTTACRDGYNGIPNNPGVTSRSNLTLQERYQYFSASEILVDNFSPLGDLEICWSANAGGSNAQPNPGDANDDKSAIIAPNPMAAGTTAATVELVAEAPVSVEVAIFDMVGKQYYAGTFELVKGNNQLPVDISKANMAAGMYTVKITGVNINKNVMLLVK